MRRKLLLLILLLGVLPAAYAGHGDWTDHYKDEHGTPCCKLRADCQPFPVRLVAYEGETASVEIAGYPMTLHRKGVHVSETAQTYWCARHHELPPTRAQTRCVFVAVSG